MKRVGIWLALTMIGQGACGLGVVENGDVTTESRGVTGFTRVTGNGEATIIVREGAAYWLT